MHDSSSKRSTITRTPTTPSAPPATGAGGEHAPVKLTFRVVGTYPHDSRAFTQGLEVAGNQLVESTGLRGESSIRLVDPTTGTVAKKTDLSAEFFGEGATVVGDEIFQLTWTSGKAFVYGLNDLAKRREFTYEGEGWGLCAESGRLVMSDGSSQLTFRNPQTFEKVGSVQVTKAGQPVTRLNELECANDYVWANRFGETEIVVIEPSNGQVVATLDVSSLVPDAVKGSRDKVVNGIAYNAATGRYYLTGKQWPALYEVAINGLPLSSSSDLFDEGLGEIATFWS